MARRGPTQLAAAIRRVPHGAHQDTFLDSGRYRARLAVVVTERTHLQRLKNWQLFAVCVVVWSTTWHAILYQIAHLSPEVGIALRFGLAGAIVLALCVMRREPLRFTPSQHGLLLLQGSFMYGVSYIFVYYAERYVASGLVAVGYSASPLLTGLGARALFHTRLTLRFVAGGLLGLAGVALIFWPEFGKAVGNDATALGVIFTIAAVLLSSIGNLVASRNHLRGLTFWPTLGFGMIYGAGVSTVVALARGGSFVPPAVLSWWLSLLYLSIAGSVLTFACFLMLQRRIGPSRTSTIGVMTPLLALVVSMVFEDFHPGALTYAGAALAFAGNVMMLRRSR
jgi:drug/metabolite transporter (DMT)-like permease